MFSFTLKSDGDDIIKREDMKSFDELMNLFDHESLIDEEIILMGIERYTSFMSENNRDITLSSLKSVIDDRLYDYFDAYYENYYSNKSTCRLLYHSEIDGMYYELFLNSNTFYVLKVNIYRRSAISLLR